MTTQDSSTPQAPSWSQFSPGAQALLVLVMAAGIGVALLTMLQLSSGSFESDTLMWVLLAFITGSLTLRLPFVRASLSMDTLFVLALLLTGDMSVAVIVSGLTMMVGELRSSDSEGRLWYTLPFNFATGVLSAAAAAAVLGHEASADLEAGLVVQVLACAMSYFVVNIALVSLAVRLTRGVPMVKVLQKLVFTGPAFLGAGSIAGLAVWALNFAPTLVLLTTPLAVLLYATVHKHKAHAEAVESHAAEVERLYLPTVAAIAAAIEARDAADGGHHVRVQRLSLALAEEMGLRDAKTLRAVRFGALLHDLGRLAISDAVLLKEGDLTPGERKQLELHPVLGAELIRHIPFDAPVAESIRYHHERWDGQGYPERLKGEEIPLPARLIAVAEAYDSMVSPSISRKGRCSDEVVAVIMEERGRQFAPDVADALVGALRRLKGQVVSSRASTALKLIASGALSQGLELNLSAELRHASSFQDMLEIAARTSARSLPVSCWLLIGDERGQGGDVRSLAMAGDDEMLEALMHEVFSGRAPGVDEAIQWWQLADGEQGVILRLQCQSQALEPALVLRFAEGQGGALWTDALSQALTGPISAAVERIHQSALGERLALTDVLTQLGNRLALERALEGVADEGVPLGVLLLDLNNFKGINDHFGHDVGDDALKMVGIALRNFDKCHRTTSFRCGGDEFVILTRSPQQCFMLRKKVRARIGELRLEVSAQELLPLGTSVGVGTAHTILEGHEALFKAADEDMFRDKANNPKRLPRGAKPQTLKRDSPLLAVSKAFKSMTTLDCFPKRQTTSA